MEQLDTKSGGFTPRIFQEMLGVHLRPGRNQKFESISLQRRVRANSASGDNAPNHR
jgi:hypothetical protein